MYPYTQSNKINTFLNEIILILNMYHTVKLLQYNLLIILKIMK